MALFQSGAILQSPPAGRVSIDTGGSVSAEFNVAATTVTVNGATPVTVTNTAVTATSSISVTLKTVGGSVGAIPAIQTITPGTGFTVAATAGDTSVYNVLIIG